MLSGKAQATSLNTPSSLSSQSLMEEDPAPSGMTKAQKMLEKMGWKEGGQVYLVGGL